MMSLRESALVGNLLLVLAGVTSCFCDTELYVPPSGVIYSPKYPRPYDNNTNCMWHIRSREPKATIMLSVEDLDIEMDDPEMCDHPKSKPCCKQNWLSLPLSGVGKVKTQQVCGHQFPSKPILVRAPEVAVKLHISHVDKGGRGFRLSYKLLKPQDCRQPFMLPCGFHVADGCYNSTQHCDGDTQCVTGRDEMDCGSWCDFRCASSNACYTQEQRCNGKPDCQDYSDEAGCDFCEKGEVRCSPTGHHCFRLASQRCNGRFDCPWGEDEVGCVPGCKDKIACSGGEGCYNPSQRCDSLSDCMDGSDETLCPPQLCATMRDHRQCRNGRCLPIALWCDGVDDCDDNSDEQSCLKNSVIALAIMGSLFCGLLLVLAVGCAFRFYGHRYSSSSSNYHLHISPHLASRLRMTSSVSLPTLMADELFHREPPPAYSVAVGETDASVVPVPTTRPRRMRRTRLRPVPPPQVVVKPPDSPLPDEASSSQSSPSRDSSSSYLSGTDDTLLLSS